MKITKNILRKIIREEIRALREAPENAEWTKEDLSFIKKMKRKIRRKQGPVRSKKVTVDGIQFASGLEKYMYLALKKAKIKAKYEGETYV